MGGSQRDPAARAAFYEKHAQLLRYCASVPPPLHFDKSCKELVEHARAELGYSSGTASPDLLRWVINGWRSHNTAHRS